ncbi:hypothetical protein ACCT30_18395 [Rhizobium ruizarguesonis]
MELVEGESLPDDEKQNYLAPLVQALAEYKGSEIPREFAEDPQNRS